MSETCPYSRRSFLKSAAAGTAGIAVAGPVVNSVLAAPAANMAWNTGMKINPDIDNTKVVCCYDDAMVSDHSRALLESTFSAQNGKVNTPRVEANMDELAKSLSGKTSADQAWATIFRKPASKEWSAVKAAIKVNCITTRIMPRIAIVGKVCKELMRLGVPAASITVFDSGHGASGSTKYTPFIGNGLPAGVVVSTTTKSGVKVPVGTGTLTCTSVLAQGSGDQVSYPVDILVNCAVNKGHEQNDKGGYTLSMKNHTGTLKFSCPSLTEMINENKCDAILGGTPVRQQLCIVDSLWAAKTGPTNPPDSLPCRIAMGTFGPAIDVMVARNIREKVMKVTNHNNAAINTILTAFNYKESDLTWIDVAPAGNTKTAGIKETKSTANLKVICSRLKQPVQVTIQQSHFPVNLSIFDSNGKRIKNLGEFSSAGTVAWDAADEHGRSLAPGNYVLQVKSNNSQHSRQLKIMR